MDWSIPLDSSLEEVLSGLRFQPDCLLSLRFWIPISPHGIAKASPTIRLDVDTYALPDAGFAGFRYSITPLFVTLDSRPSSNGNRGTLPLCVWLTPPTANTLTFRKLRVFEALDSGAPLLTPLPNELTSIGFVPGVHFVGFHNEAELHTFVRHYLDDPKRLASHRPGQGGPRPWRTTPTTIASGRSTNICNALVRKSALRRGVGLNCAPVSCSSTFSPATAFYQAANHSSEKSLAMAFETPWSSTVGLLRWLALK